MACNKQCYHFVSHLLVTHPLPRLLITCQQKHREQVTRVRVLLAALGDNAMHYLVKGATCGLQAPVA
jgi:hypothetical protein